MKTTLLAAVTASAMFVAASASAGLLIDDYDAPGAGYFSSAPQAGDTSMGPSSTGIDRSLDSASSGSSLDIAINNTVPGVLSYSTGAGITGSAELSYDLAGAGVGDLSGDDRFRLEIDSIDFAPTLAPFIGVEVTDSMGSASSTMPMRTIFINALGGGGFPVSVDFLFSGFAGIDFSDVQSVALLISTNPDVALDVTIDQFETVMRTQVPTPGGLALFGLALAGLSLRKRTA